MQQDLTDLLQDDTTKSSVSLNLSRRNIETLPDAIGTLQHLEILSLASNKLTSLPISMNGLTSLRYLNLRSNAIREFPMVLCNMPSLEILDLSRNKLKRLPQVFGSLLTLKVLSIARNRIQSLPVYIGKMTRLEVLKLDGNPIQWPPPDVLNCADEENAEEWLNGVKEFLGKDHSPGIDVTTNTFTDSTPAFQLQKPIDLTQNPPDLGMYAKKGSKECHILVDLYLTHAPPPSDAHEDAIRSLAHGISQLYVLLKPFTDDAASAELNRRMIAMVRGLLEGEGWDDVSSVISACVDVVKGVGVGEMDKRLLRKLVAGVKSANLELRIGGGRLKGFESDGGVCEKCLEVTEGVAEAFLGMVEILKEVGLDKEILETAEGVGKELGDTRERVLGNMQDVRLRNLFVGTTKRFIDTSIDLITRVKSVSLEVGLSKDLRTTIQTTTKAIKRLASVIYSGSES